MSSNVSLRYGFEWDRDYFIDASMLYQFYMPIIGIFTFHPVMQYLLFFENKSMKKDIRILYILTHLALILNEWSFCFSFHIYPVSPYAALYCEGFICKLGIDKQMLMAILSVPVIFIVIPFIPLSCIMHQAFLPSESSWKLSGISKILLFVSLNVLLFTNTIGFYVFGRDHDDAELLMEAEPELLWLKSRGGTIFLFGPPGDAQYFKWELFFLAFSILLITPFLYFFTVDAMHNIAKTTSRFQSGFTQKMAKRMFHIFLIQCLGAFICYIVPLTVMLGFMIIDTSDVHGKICAPLRIILLILFSINGHQFCVFFILKSPTYRKVLTRKLVRFLSVACHLEINDNRKESMKRSSVTPTMNTMSLVRADIY